MRYLLLIYTSESDMPPVPVKGCRHLTDTLKGSTTVRHP